MSSVILANDFKIENVSFKEPKKNSNGGLSILLNYFNEKTNKNGPLLVQTPKMRMPFGVDAAESENGGPIRYSFNVSLAKDDSDNTNLITFSKIISKFKFNSHNR